jgi:hypothetical protein
MPQQLPPDMLQAAGELFCVGARGKIHAVCAVELNVDKAWYKIAALDVNVDVSLAWGGRRSGGRRG